MLFPSDFYTVGKIRCEVKIASLIPLHLTEGFDLRDFCIVRNSQTAKVTKWNKEINELLYTRLIELIKLN